MTKTSRLFAVAHVAFWLAMAAAAYAKAGSYTFASCWGLLLLLPMPVVLGCGAIALAVLANGMFRPKAREAKGYLAALNVVILVGGLAGALFAGREGGPYNCL
ncbi:hypothetical protein [Aminobacter sp. HY435]|uniref:hypothetical protein n=1 Tax=Aminobacter sp. HY435 TaxID=2970917 RepID=UPI0022B95C9D|nr:hypothetical protein [Aminobacter sp. HY435]